MAQLAAGIMSSTYPSTSTAALVLTDDGDTIGLSYEKLRTEEIIDSVKDDGAGALAVFIGTTRDSFQGKTVTRLTYEAYTTLCIKTIKSMIVHARSLPSSSTSHALPASPETGRRLTRVAVHHRLGEVPVREASIVIAVSSPHRREAFEACEYLLEEVKKKAQIWKREWYADHVAGHGDLPGSGRVGRDGQAVAPVDAAWKENFPAKGSI